MLNTEDIIENADITRRSKVSAAMVKKETALLYRSGFLLKKPFIKMVLPKGSKKDAVAKKKKAVGWKLNTQLSILPILKKLILNSEPLQKTEIANRFKKVGKVKLIITSGIFMQEDDSRVDLLIVGDNLNKGMIETTLRSVEAEMGKELSYAFFDTQEYKYRIGICDKFVRDVLDYPHQVVIDKITPEEPVGG